MTFKPLSNTGFLVFLVLLCLFPLESDVCANVVSASSSPLDRITAIRLYGVQDGVLFQNTVVREAVVDLDRLEVEGYVSGIVVFCDGPMGIRLEGHYFSKLRKSGDGVYSAQNSGSPVRRVQPVSIHDNGYFDGIDSRRRAAATRLTDQTVYAYFPQVQGGAVWHEGHFQLHFQAENMTTRLEVHQIGYNPEPLHYSKTRVPFQYHGTRLAELETHIPDLKQRLAAIGRGIAFVEEAVGAALVSEAVILDYSAVKNAITRKDSDAVWFYMETFRGEPIDELETIAAHETLHKYVDRRRLIHSTRIRELFSDLKDFSPLSLERFLMVSQGILSYEDETSGPAAETFFHFISEKHFIENRKGGHAGDNLDEFCTSFIHSVLHIHRLEENLSRPIRQSEGLDRFLTVDEQRDILEAYTRALEVFKDAISIESKSVVAERQDAASLRRGLSLAKQIRGSGVATTSADDS